MASNTTSMLSTHRLLFAPLAIYLVAGQIFGQVALPVTPVAIAPKFVGWPMYGCNPQHSAQSPYVTQTMNQVLWQTPVDLAPQYSGTLLLTHYGSPLATAGGTLIVTVKTGASSGFQLEGRNIKNGDLIWTQPTGWTAPPHNWFPSLGSCITAWNEVAIPGPGGTVLFRSKLDSPVGTVRTVAFYGTAAYNANPAGFNSSVIINTPIICDSRGNLFFGYLVTGTPPIVGLQSGIARLSVTGVGTYVSASTASGSTTARKIPTNCAPALSLDEASLYVPTTTNATSGSGSGYMLKLNSTTLVQQARILMKDARNTANNAALFDDGTASPLIGPDGDLYYGVLESPFGSNNSRGWLLHYNGALTLTKIPGAFGWDDTPSIVPASAVPSYHGTSAYLIMSKYNNYGGTATGTGLNKIAVLDPSAGFTEPVSGVTCMNEILTVLGPTPDPSFPGGFREWCINSAAIDVTRRSAIVNCEDGICYRWDFVTNTLVEPVVLTTGIGEAYTMTIVGPLGISFAINNATLFALGN